MTVNEVDVLVVGGGPAGLFSALEVARRSSLRVMVIDAGPDIEARSSPQPWRGKDYRVWGVGGAGMFSDGKLCLSLGVGGELGALLPEEAQRATLLHRVARELRALEALKNAAVPKARIAEAERAGLDFTYYPVFHIGSDHCADSIRLVRDAVVAAGARIDSNTELIGLKRGIHGFEAALRNGQDSRTVIAERVVLAMGKVGSARQAQQCSSLGASVRPLPMYVGVRLETDRAIAAPLFRELVDPKYKLYFDDGSKVKMHCASDGGIVLPLRYDGFVLAGGHAHRDKRSPRSSFGVLWNGLHVGKDAIRTARTLMQRAASIAPDVLIAQRLSDYLDRRPSTRASVERSRPSTEAWAAGDLRALLPDEYFDRFAAFIHRLTRVVPDLVTDLTLVFGPAIEWWMTRVETDTNLETRVPGLFVAGDGSGWSQGIVHAAATGFVVADGILRKTTEELALVSAVDTTAVG